MTFIMATNVVASRPPEWLERRTLLPIHLIFEVVLILSFSSSPNILTGADIVGVWKNKKLSESLYIQ